MLPEESNIRQCFVGREVSCRELQAGWLFKSHVLELPLNLRVHWNYHRVLVSWRHRSGQPLRQRGVESEWEEQWMSVALQARKLQIWRDLCKGFPLVRLVYRTFRLWFHLKHFRLLISPTPHELSHICYT
jgi:hypothetical protein